MSLFDTIINFLQSIFGGNNQASSSDAPAQQTTSVQNNPNNVEGTNMRKSVFTVMTAGEKDASQIENIKKQMQKMDAIGVYPYIISSNAWMYTITKPAEPHFTMYGTQYSAAQKHK